MPSDDFQQLLQHAMRQYPNRTARQPIRWRCMNPECHQDGHWFEFDRDVPKCPKCGLEGVPFVQMRTLVHFLMRDNASGPVFGQSGRFFVPCDPTRKSITDGANNEAGTGDPRSVTCPGCRKWLAENMNAFHLVGDRVVIDRKTGDMRTEPTPTKTEAKLPPEKTERGEA